MHSSIAFRFVLSLMILAAAWGLTSVSPISSDADAPPAIIVSEGAE